MIPYEKDPATQIFNMLNNTWQMINENDGSSTHMGRFPVILTHNTNVIREYLRRDIILRGTRI